MNKILVSILVLSAQIVFAAGVCQPGDRPGSNCSPIPNTADNGGGVQQSANDAKKANDGGNMLGQLGTIIGAGFAAMNASTCFGPPENTCPQFAMGLAGLAAGMMMSGDHGSAGAGAVDSGNAATIGGTSADASGSNLPTYGEMQKSIEGLKKQGVIVDTKKGTIALPNGSLLSAKDATDAGKLSAAMGSSVSQDALNSGMKGIFAKAQEKTNALMKNYSGTDSNTIDGGSGSRGGGGESYADSSAAAHAPTTITIAQDRAPAAKITLKKQFGDSFIGDANENIFGMVNNRFKLKDSENSFISSAPAVNK